MIYFEEIANYLEERQFAKQGKTLFLYRLPHEIKDGILLIDRMTGAERFRDLPGYSKTRFRGIVRATRMCDLQSRAFALSEALNFKEETRVGRVLFKELYPINDPIVYPMSEGAFFEAAINFQTAFVRDEMEIEFPVWGESIWEDDVWQDDVEVKNGIVCS